MWVRSQNKTLLINCNNFSIEGYDNCLDIETIEAVTGTHTTLGSYSTYAKALKVLDEICYQINSLSNDYVYQMPQDGEVKDND